MFERVPALLALSDGTVLRGVAAGAEGYGPGEVVFNTAMSGYQEILTDPSYTGQIVTLTASHVGNTGVNDEDCEGAGAGRIHAAGLVVRHAPRRASSFRSERSLQSWLVDQGIVAVAEVDTRELTRILRESGVQGACVAAGSQVSADEAVDRARAFGTLDGVDLARQVSTEAAYAWTEGEWALGAGFTTPAEQNLHVVVYDFGVKRNILRMLVSRGCRLTVVPATTPAAEVLALRPDGVLLSNGPGDPAACGYAVQAIRELLEARVPLFGICLGHQLLGLASGARTLKLRFGHHGANHPVQDTETGSVHITSQNHNYAVDASSLPASVRVSHVSLFDGSLQGIAWRDRPAFGFQGHPEASPGPHDLGFLFDHFVHQLGGQS